MAKWGEGDPRWIVEERPDATNVNNWHWTEKNANQWSQDKIKSLFTNLEIDMDKAKVKITEVESCKGEAVANNRKGKLIFFYEWEITLKWVGRLSGEEEDIEGKIDIPNLSEENSVEEVEVNISLEKSSSQGTLLKEFLYNQGRSRIREQLGKYISCLKEEFSQGMILPKKDDDGTSVNSITSGFKKKTSLDLPVIQSSDSSSDKLKTSTVDFNHSFVCTGAEFYNIMTSPELVSVFTNGPAKLDPKVGGKFELFGGNIQGEFLELVPEKKIIQHWRLKSWPNNHFSTVTMNIEQREDHTQVIVTQTNVPESEAENTRINWERYYWEAIKRTLGLGSFL